MTTVLTPWPRSQFLDNNGRPAVGYQLFTYIAGTDTKLDTFTDSTGLSANTNPIKLDFRGEASIWVPPNVAYKYVLAPPSDTDPPTNPIWSVDQLVSSQLITLYGGVDTGGINTYVLTFTANFKTYEDGIIIYFTPTSTNTGSAFLNVNGLGFVQIVNQNGSPLAPGQITANQIAQVMYRSGFFRLLTYAISNGSFTPTWTGFSAAPSGLMLYQRTGNLITLTWNGTTGVSNINSMTINNLPIELRPDTSIRSLIGMQTCVVIDNGNHVAGSVGHGSSGIVQFNMGAPLNGTGFNPAGTKGIDAGWTFTYRIL